MHRLSRRDTDGERRRATAGGTATALYRAAIVRFPFRIARRRCSGVDESGRRHIIGRRHHCAFRLSRLTAAGIKGERGENSAWRDSCRTACSVARRGGCAHAALLTVRRESGAAVTSIRRQAGQERTTSPAASAILRAHRSAAASRVWRGHPASMRSNPVPESCGRRFVLSQTRAGTALRLH